MAELWGPSAAALREARAMELVPARQRHSAAVESVETYATRLHDDSVDLAPRLEALVERVADPRVHQHHRDCSAADQDVEAGAHLVLVVVLLRHAELAFDASRRCCGEA